jgi:LmbE family N-acetylglucosaminyl deacetylase
MKVLAVGANPDDVEFLCAGTLARCAGRGDQIAIAYLTTGDKGGAAISLEETAAIRREEAENAARIIGAELYPLGIPDGHVEVNLAIRRRIVEVIRIVRPDVLITHYHRDYMSDHNNTSRLVKDASFWACVAGFEGDPNQAEPHSLIPPVYYMDTVLGIGFHPEVYVDITEVMDVKIEMLSKHQSQIRYMRERDGLDFLDCMKTAARYRGYQCGVAFAEGFIAERIYPSVSPRRDLP